MLSSEAFPLPVGQPGLLQAQFPAGPLWVLWGPQAEGSEDVLLVGALSLCCHLAELASGVQPGCRAQRPSRAAEASCPCAGESAAGWSHGPGQKGRPARAGGPRQARPCPLASRLPLCPCSPDFCII